jgi:hypothetical protein
LGTSQKECAERVSPHPCKPRTHAARLSVAEPSAAQRSSRSSETDPLGDKRYSVVAEPNPWGCGYRHLPPRLKPQLLEGVRESTIGERTIAFWGGDTKDAKPMDRRDQVPAGVEVGALGSGLAEAHKGPALVELRVPLRAGMDLVRLDRRAVSSLVKVSGVDLVGQLAHGHPLVFALL